MGMDMTIKKMLMLKDEGMVPKTEDELEAEREVEQQARLGLRKQQSLITKLRAAEVQTQKVKRPGVGSGSDDESLDSDEERQIVVKKLSKQSTVATMYNLCSD
jgi:hypothetical protein